MSGQPALRGPSRRPVIIWHCPTAVLGFRAGDAERRAATEPRAKHLAGIAQAEVATLGGPFGEIIHRQIRCMPLCIYIKIGNPCDDPSLQYLGSCLGCLMPDIGPSI